ncbi:MAG TPA: mechanosensitive ion channel domain-containing protein [Mycobacteriales bacterium]|nr:mechanosensitive ion channel domain-containing protein [Mycobacteriales bacterium]
MWASNSAGQNDLVRSLWLHLLTPLGGALVLLEIVRRIAQRRSQQERWGLVAAIVSRCARPVWAVTVLVVFEIWLPHRFAPDSRGSVRHGLAIGLIAALTWLVVQVIYAVTDVALHKLGRALGTRDNRRARRARTQLVVIRRVIAAVAVVIAIGAILLTFTRVRALGASVLASAGIAGAVAGVAARPTIGNIIAGLQIAFSDMLRMDDVVVVVNEWGRVDDITLTYVVVRTWDERRLILPTSYFVDNPFQNWTRDEARVIGSVCLLLDFTVPVEELRAETQRIIEASPLWDRREWVLQVTDLTAQGVEVRILMSAADAPSAWDLRCDVREQLLEFLRDNYPQALPRLRISSTTTAPADEQPDAVYPAEPPVRDVRRQQQQQSGG